MREETAGRKKEMYRYLVYKNKMRLAGLLLLQTLRTLGAIGVALLINYLIDSVASAISSGQIKELISCAMVCCAYALLFGMATFFCERIKASCIRHIMLHIREAAMDGILSKSTAEMQNTNSAEYLTLMNQNLGVIEKNYLENLLAIYESLIGMVFAVVLLVAIHPVIAGISVVAMSVPSLIPKLFGNRLGRLQGNIVQCETAYNVRIKDILNGHDVIRTYQTEDIMRGKHRETAAKLEQSKVSSANAMASLYGLVNLASISVQFLIMTLCGVFAVRGVITIGSIVAVTQLTGQVISPAFQLSTKFSQLKAVKPVCERILTLTQAAAGEKKLTAEDPERSLCVENLSFSYQDTPVIKNINAGFEAGKKYAIVGRSGCGKSTLLKILAGCYEEYSGQIKVDGASGRQCSPALISQNVFLFDDTIRNNVTLYQEYPEEAVGRAIRMAGLKETIDALEKGIHTEVEENGARFSGGERQRIAIARALLHSRKLLLLDEATSSLDNECAREVEENILNLEGITCIAVTHKLYADILRKYDRILVMEDGRIVEQGTFDELLENAEVFRKLYAAGAA